MTTAPDLRRARRVGLLLTLALLVVAGCGKTGSTAASPGTVEAGGTTTTAAGADTTATTEGTEQTSESFETAPPQTTTTATTAPTEVTHDEFVVAGNAVCKKINDQLDKLGDPSFPTDRVPTQAEMNTLADYLQKVLDLAIQEDKELKALDVPRADAKAFAAANALNAEPIAQVTKAIAQLRAGDYKRAIAGIQALQTIDVDKAFDDLGLKQCGSAA